MHTYMQMSCIQTEVQRCSKNTAFHIPIVIPNWAVDELMAVGVLIDCQERLWTKRSLVAQRAQHSCGAMASPHAAHSDLESLHLLSTHSEGTGAGLRVALWSRWCRCSFWARERHEKEGWTSSTMLKLWFKLSKSIIKYQPASGRHIHSRKPCAGIGTTVTRSRFWRWVGGWAMTESWMRDWAEAVRCY